jgi:hypothetical protein
MTANDVYTIALSFLSENTMETNDVQQFTLGWLNLLLQESLPYENAYRQVNKMQPLNKAPQLAAFNEEIPYNDNITRIALPYGLASYYFIDDDNDYRAQDFRGRYINALAECVPYEQSGICDVYTDEGEVAEDA